MPGDNNPNNSVGDGWHLTHNIIKQIYSYSANSGKKFYDTKRNPNIKCKNNMLIFESVAKINGKVTEIDTGIIFDTMIIFLLSKPKNNDDNSYNTKLPLLNQNLDQDPDSINQNNLLSLKNIDLPKKTSNKTSNKNKKHRNKNKTHNIDK